LGAEFVNGLGTGLQKEPLAGCRAELEIGSIKNDRLSAFHIFYEAQKSQVKAGHDESQDSKNEHIFRVRNLVLKVIHKKQARAEIPKKCHEGNAYQYFIGRRRATFRQFRILDVTCGSLAFASTQALPVTIGAVMKNISNE
jgi:hypothetical protein